MLITVEMNNMMYDLQPDIIANRNGTDVDFSALEPKIRTAKSESGNPA
jgi:hypothetical protein